MANYTNLKNIIDQYITTNGQGDITGAILNGVLKSIVNSIGAEFLFAGVAEPTTNPGSPDQNVFYIAIKGGTYTNFGNVVIPNGITIFKWNGSWSNQILFAGDGGVFDITAYNNNTKYADLTAALGTNGANVPQYLQKGGISVKFVQSYDNKYVQYRLITDEWSVNTNNWVISVRNIEFDSSEYIELTTDSKGKILEGIKKNATKHIPGDLEVDGEIINPVIQEIINATIGVLSFFRTKEIPDWFNVTIDNNGKILEGINKKGQKVINIPFSPESMEKIGVGGIIKTLESFYEGSHKMTIISVKKDGSGDFASIQEAINSITDASILNQYEVQVYDDFYINDLTKLSKVSDPTQNNTAAPSVDGAFIITKDYVHLRGVGGMREIYVESPDLNMAGSCFQHVETIFVQGNCRIENFTFKVKGGRYAVHQDMSADLNGPDSYKTTIYKDIKAIHLGNQDYTNGNSGWGSQCAQANGVANGQTQIYINVCWETKSNVTATAFYVHTNADYSLPCKMVMINCRSIGMYGLILPSWGGFSFQDLYSCQNNDIFVYNCDIPQYNGRTMGQSIQNKAPHWAATKRYCFNRFIGHGNKPFVVKKETAKVLSFETKNAGYSINVIGGTAYDDLWGLTYKQESGNGIKGICYGGNYVEPGTYSQVHNLAYILGNCAANPKTLIVEITDSNNNKTQHTITFNQNYMTSDGSAYTYNTTPYISQENIIASVNTIFSSYFTMGDTMVFVDSFEDCKEEVAIKGSIVAELGTMMKKDYSLGYHCWRVANEGETPDGVAMSRIGLNSIGWVLLLHKNLFHRELFGLNSLLTTGSMFKVGPNGTLVSTNNTSEAIIIAVDNSTLIVK